MTDFDIKQTYLKFLEEDSEMTMPVAAIESLLTLLKVKQPSTSSELIRLLSDATRELKASVKNSVSLSAGCDLFTRFVLRNTHLYSDWESCKKHLVENGQLFLQRAKESRDMIAKIGFNLIKDDDTILIHSYSRVVLSLLAYCKSKFVRFRVFVTEARPKSDDEMKNGFDMVTALKSLGIPCCYIHDSQVGFVINKIDKVFMGAEGVSESGGIINHVGSYQIGVLAKNANKPLYVVSESHKFVRMFPLSPDDVPGNKIEFTTNLNIGLLETADIDFTPHQYITALVSDLGVLTPSAVSEELIKMWYD
ncbi:translation initiation factor eIF-2B subunit alpha [Pichia californica]|uniref:Translation initiation factor eIF2B subunit alpha n=1 Tax=Pichia californica TaxID=460514 RepID=A0A9P6WQ00_9ASCO|nr:translation initiation factor eIF-2B subunit alpha [[Candida] californica]KAG0691200.1 translation initiation factor eIF-2B subunit alpha [[Candida] californica]